MDEELQYFRQQTDFYKDYEEPSTYNSSRSVVERMVEHKGVNNLIFALKSSSLNEDNKENQEVRIDETVFIYLNFTNNRHFY